MADVWNIALVTFMLIAALHIKNPAFVTSDTISLSIEGKELVSNKDSLIVSSLWNSRGGKLSSVCDHQGEACLLYYNNNNNNNNNNM